MKAGGTITNGRKECPKCGRKGVGFAPHPHAFGYKDYARARCRYCAAIFRLNGDPFAPAFHSQFNGSKE